MEAWTIDDGAMTGGGSNQSESSQPARIHPSGAMEGPRSPPQRSSRRVVSGSTALEEKIEVMAGTLTALTELLNQPKAPAIRKVKSSPKTQASSSEESASEAESEEVSSDESVDPHKARPLPPTSIAGPRQSSNGSKTAKKKSIRMMARSILARAIDDPIFFLLEKAVCAGQCENGDDPYGHSCGSGFGKGQRASNRTNGHMDHLRLGFAP